MNKDTKIRYVQVSAQIPAGSDETSELLIWTCTWYKRLDVQVTLLNHNKCPKKPWEETLEFQDHCTRSQRTWPERCRVVIFSTDLLGFQCFNKVAEFILLEPDSLQSFVVPPWSNSVSINFSSEFRCSSKFCFNQLLFKLLLLLQVVFQSASHRALTAPPWSSSVSAPTPSLSFSSQCKRPASIL